ncbi:hypothetical protein DFH11DRAFT_859771 [Phellopilus nigrolimitatus]|nr:hypothetical protein DFH11DRAFT_859771 [Phellopilus nigrolimitatus]
MNGVNGMEGRGVHQDSAAYSCSLAPTYAFNQYAQGPQGDPFAPQPPPQFFPDPNLHTPTDELAQTVSKPVKRKRRPRREEECGFCGGSDSKNRQQQPERMVVCNDCGRSGHPSCMELGDIGAILRNYQWKCIECKICEICQEKGDDVSLTASFSKRHEPIKF